MVSISRYIKAARHIKKIVAPSTPMIPFIGNIIIDL
jgi:hypothetical protein